MAGQVLDEYISAKWLSVFLGHVLESLLGRTRAYLYIISDLKRMQKRSGFLGISYVRDISYYVVMNNPATSLCFVIPSDYFYAFEKIRSDYD